MKKTNITLSIALAAVFSASTAFAEAEVTGKIVHESAKFTTSGTTIGAATAHDKDVMKTETSARIYIDGDAEAMQEGATYHVELNLMRDSKGVGKHDGNESYTQRDALREAYVDGVVDDWSIRAGKQQVVWGTADGMKLLDMINPTDYSEMAQNQMEDSRIPVWMINAEKTNEDGSESQVVISQPRENVFAGLDRNISTAVRENDTTINGSGIFADLTTGAGHSQGHAFIMKGPDSITGKTNGFVNIAPDLGSVARAFANGFGSIAALSGSAMAGFSVAGFSSMSMETMGRFLELSSLGDGGSADDGSTKTDDADDWLELPANFQGAAANVASALPSRSSGGEVTGAEMLDYGFGSAYDTNLTSYSTSAGVRNSAFEYMDRATFKTFDAFVNAKSQYVYNMPDNELDLAYRYKNSTSDGANYSLNYAYAYDKNPIINISFRDTDGNKLDVSRSASTVDTTGDGAADFNTASLSLSGYGGLAQASDATKIPTLRFEHKVERAHNIGGSFDTSIETSEFGPVVIRGEALYQKDVYQAVMDRGALSIGDLPAALTMRKGDRFKYVLGADITALTNMMVSMQFIQDRNLDYIDNNIDFDGSTCAAGLDNCGVYSTDYATMHLTNDFNKAEKDKNFYSLFFSKPFGASGEHRWNNIFMFEENGGKWNRLDAEFSIDDDTQATVEYNKYWGDANTQFGQLEASSNIQVGVKYSF